MFYSSWELRNQTEYCTPKGPNFKWAPLVKFAVDETQVQLRVPRHRTNLKTEPHHPRSTYNLNGLYLDNSIADRPEWGSLPLIYRIWEFYGPWFTGRLGAISMSLSILSPRKLQESASFFHPRALENGIADYLTYRFGSERAAHKNAQAWLAPVGWQPVEGLPCLATRFDVINNKQGAFQRGQMSRYFFLPITNHHLLRLSFRISRNQYLPEDNEKDRDVDEWINIAPMKALADDVINSLQITLSPEAQAQQTKALSSLADTSLVKEFPPLKW